MPGEKVVVIGGGVGGYAAALRASRLGARVTLIEKEKIGGVCLNKGCIPTKVLLHSSSLLHEIRRADLFGLDVGGVAVDYGRIQARKNEVVEKLTGGVAGLLRAGKVRLIEGTATFADAGTVRIEGSGETVPADRVIVATGSVPARLAIPGSDTVAMLTSDDLLALDAVPESLIMVGGGYIGVELGQFFARMGTRVTIVEMRKAIVPTEDADIARTLAASLSREGIAILTGASVEKVEKAGGANKVTLKTSAGRREIEAAEIAQTVGRTPNFRGLGLERIGVTCANGAIAVNERMQTSVPHIYAVGDVTGGILLAHVAMAEAECAAANALGRQAAMSYRAVPRCIYTAPEIGCVGLTEEQVRAERGEVRVSRFPLRATGKALLMGKPDGMIKIVADSVHGEILGVHIIGPHATEMIAESVLAIGMECTVEELAHAIHPHPTVSEGIGEAAMMLAGGALHLPWEGA